MRCYLLICLLALIISQLHCADLSARVLSVYSENESSIQAGQAIRALVLIQGGSAPFTVFRDSRKVGSSNKRLMRFSLQAAATEGAHQLHIQIRDALDHHYSIDIQYYVGDLPQIAITPSVTSDATPLNTLLVAENDEDDWGDEEESEDVEDPYLKNERTVYPWTDNQSRAIMNTMLPSAVAIGKGEWYYRILHIARERIDDEPMTNFIGLDDNVKIGFQISYGIFEDFDLNFQRTNGRAMQVNLSDTEPTKMDYYDFIFRYQFLKQQEGAWVDAAIHFGPTLMLRNKGSGEQSLNTGIVFEKNIMKDRLRIGSGIVYASLSTYEQTIGKGPATKLTPDEYAALIEVGSPTPPAVDEHTLSIPLNFKYALSKKQQIFAEFIVPIDGYETRAGPSIAAGYRINSNTHEYSIYLSNTANPSYNGAITGGHDFDEINLFGFFISAYF